jgi:methionyl-tRNA formyltransferase
MKHKYVEIMAKCISKKEKKLFKIGYFADGQWSHKTFEKMIIDDDLKIQFICVRFDTKDETLKKYCDKHQIDYLKHQNINSAEFLSLLRKYECNLFISMSFNQIFKKKIINLPKDKTINCHAGKLPYYRGRNALNWVLINGEKDFGITVHYMDVGIDTGDIIMQRAYEITDEDNYETLLETSYVQCANTLYDSVKLIQNNEIEPVKQRDIHPIGFYCNQRKDGDESISWNQTSQEVFNFVRAICKPGPMARAIIKNKEMMINKVRIVENAPIYKGVIGAVVGKDNNGIYVKTMDSFVKITEYYFNGKIRIGDRFQN